MLLPKDRLKSRPSPSLRPLCSKDRNPPGSAFLVFRVRRICRNGKLPEPGPFSLVLYLAHPHRSHHGLITDLNIRIDAQIVHPSRIRWRPALRPDQDVAVAVLNAHQGGLTDCAGLITDVGYDDHRQPCITQGGAFGTAATFVTLDLLAHPVSGAGNILCHRTLHRREANVHHPSRPRPVRGSRSITLRAPATHIDRAHP